jgi:nicotinamidase/pyrazinamidase
VRALVIVDFQNDFTPGGALAVRDGDAIAGRVDELARSGDFDVVVATRDWHPPDHHSFDEQGGAWPVHCVQDSPGAQLRVDLAHELIDRVVDAGVGRQALGFDKVGESDLADWLRGHDVDRVHVGGLALDYCVKHTALGARRAGFEVIVHRDATRAVNVEPGDDERAVAELRAAGVEMTE